LPPPHSQGSEAQAIEILSAILARSGWEVALERRLIPRGRAADLVARRDDVTYAVELKSASEGRADRLVPLWAQAHLEATQATPPDAHPMAVIFAPRIAPRAAEQLLRFAAEVAPHAGCGVFDRAGLRRFRGPGLDGLDADPVRGRRGRREEPASPGNLFSDLNQWMLKVLIAPDLPESLLAAPRVRPRNAAELARIADVSAMSAHRLVRQLEREGHLHESRPFLSLVRRAELFRRWKAVAAERVREVPMRFLFQGDVDRELRKLLHDHHGCLGLFAAAQALGAGHVRGIPPHVYLGKAGLEAAGAAGSRTLLPAQSGETPDLIVRIPSAPHAVFRGQVSVNGAPCCDIMQVWLDVSAHPARGAEQAAVIEREFLGPVVEDSDDD
ncbi:MAG: hypothetical protein ABR602_13720, partial [Gemmatimonadales bacterium]